MKRGALFSVAIWTLLLWSTMAFGGTITIYTEEFPPFNYTENGEITGVSTEIVRAVMDRTGLEYTIESYPWARSYNLVQQNPDALIYSISRRPNREDLFHWIGTVIPVVRYSVFTLQERDDIVINELEDLKNYTIGTSIEDAREAYLVSKGFDLKDFDRVGGDKSHSVNLQKLKTKRIDLWPVPDALAYYVARQEGDDPDSLARCKLQVQQVQVGLKLMIKE